MTKWQPRLIACIIASALAVYLIQYGAAHPWFNLITWPALTAGVFVVWGKLQTK